MHATWVDRCYVIFSNESKFNLFGLDGWQYCWRRSGEHLLGQHVQPPIKFGRGSIMVWECMKYYGLGMYELGGNWQSSFHRRGYG
jgi:hypothetical protein